MKKRNTILLLVGLVITLIAMVTTFIFYKSKNNLVIYTRGDSYAHSYAKKNLIRTFDVSDSDQERLNLHYEEFHFDIIEGNVEITKYEGISEKLYIPEKINGSKVTSIAKDALPETVKTIVLPNSVEKLPEEQLENVEIQCYKTDYCKGLQDNKELKVKLLSDSDLYYVDNSPKGLIFTLEDDEITITNYVGKEEILVIPETINGYKVTTLKIDGVHLSAIYIPNSVKSISGDITSKTVNTFFKISMAMEIIAFIVFLIVTIPDTKKDLTEAVYLAPKALVSVIYLGIIIFLVNKIRLNPLFYRNYMAIAISVSFVYMLLCLLLSKVKKQNVEYDEKMKKTGSFIKEAQEIIDDMDDKEYDEVKEELKYSDPVSNESVEELEREIISLLKDKENKNEILKKLKKRNKTLKDNK